MTDVPKPGKFRPATAAPGKLKPAQVKHIRAYVHQEWELALADFKDAIDAFTGPYSRTTLSKAYAAGYKVMKRLWNVRPYAEAINYYDDEGKFAR